MGIDNSEFPIIHDDNCGLCKLKSFLADKEAVDQLIKSIKDEIDK